MRELEPSRTADSSTYLLSDGSYSQVIYEQPIHYQAASGRWENIDPTLVPTPDYGVSHTRASAYDIAVASDDATADPVSITHAGWSLGMRLAGGEQSSVFELGNQAFYPLAMTDTQLNYEAGGDTLKETLLLTSRRAPDTFTFHLSLAGLSVYESPVDGGFTLLDGRGESAGRIEPLAVFDSATDEAGDPTAVCASATTSVSRSGDGVDITYHVPRAWLDDPARVWPVKVDPTYTGSGSAATCDTFYSSGNSGTSYTTADHVDVGKASTGTDLRRTLVSFDMSLIPTGIQIDSAQLHLYCYSNASGSSQNVWVDGVDNAWHGGSHYTWANTFGNGYLQWNSLGDRVSGAVPGGNNNHVYFYPTSIVQSWYNATPNRDYSYGFLLLADGEGAGTLKCFHSSRYNTTPSQRPSLTVNYTEPSITGSFDKTSYKPGDTVRATVRVSTKNPGASTSVSADMHGFDGQGDYTARGSFTWCSTDPGNGFSYDSAFGDDPTIIPDLASCSTATDSGGRTVTFVYRIGSAYGDVQQNHMVVSDSDWESTDPTDPGLTFSVAPSSPDTTPSVNTTASASWWNEASGNDDTATAGRGSISAQWSPTASASAYKIYLLDGAQYRCVDSTTATAWTSSGRGVYPTDSTISSWTTGSVSAPFNAAHTALDLRDDPRALYTKVTGGTNQPLAYFVKVVPSNSATDAPLSTCPTLTVELDGRTKHIADEPRHTTADLGNLFGNVAQARVDTGDLTLSTTDLSIPGAGPDVSVDRFYRSSATASSYLAPGWSFSFERNILSTPSTATYFDEAGDAHVFRNLGGNWIPPHGDTDSLSTTGTYPFTLTHKDLSSTSFDSTGRLAAERDCNGNTVTYQWAGDGSTLAILCPKDSWPLSTRRITVTFSGGRVTKAIAHITEGGSDPNNADREVDYDTQAMGLTVTRLPGTNASSTVVYGYDGSNRISSVSVPGFQPSDAGSAVWSVTYPGPTSVHIQNDTGAGTPAMPLTVSWNSAGGTATAASASGTSTLSFDPTGEEVSSTLENTSAATVDAYDVEGNQIREISPGGSVTSGIYDNRGNQLASTDENGALTTYAYDSLDRCTTQTDPSGSVTTRTYYASTGNIHHEYQTLNDTQSAHTEYAYNSDGTTQWEKKDVDASHTLVTDYYDYANSGDAQSVKQENVETANGVFQSLITHSWTDGYGDVESQVDALSKTTQINDLDASGRVLSAVDASGTTTHATYGPLGGVTRIWQSNSASPTAVIGWRENDYDAAGNVVTETVKASDGHTVATTVHRYDAAGRETTSDASDVPGSAVTKYDSQGNVSQSWDEGADIAVAAASSRAVYDSEGQDTSSTAPGSVKASDTTTYTPSGDTSQTSAADGATTSYQYDAAGNLSTETASTDASQALISYDYDDDGRTVAETDPNGTEKVTTYDLDDDVVSEDVAGAQPACTKRLNALGWTLSVTDPDGIVTQNTYDADGRVTSSTVGALTTTTHYDDTGKVSSRANPDGTTVSYSYDPFGRQTGVTETSGGATVKLTSALFDLTGKVATRTVAWPLQWPWARSLTSTTAPDGTVSTTESCDAGACTLSSTRDGAGLLRSWNATDYGVPVDFSVLTTDAAGRVVATRSTALPVSRTATYADAGQLQGTTLGSASADYGYSPVSGKETTQTFHFALGGRSETDSYAYDPTGRLATATINGLTTIYTYDADTGALLASKAGTATTFTLSYETTSPQHWTGHLVSAGSTLYRYDSNGHRTYSGPASNPTQTSYTWSGDRLVHFSGPSGVATYTYDAAGQRIGSVVASASLVTTTAYDYEGTTLLGLSAARSDGANWKLRYLHDDAGRSFAGVYQSNTTSATPFLIETTDRGDVRELLASNGSSFALYTWDAYGLPTSTVTASAGSLTATRAVEISGRQPLRYAGYAYDTESGLYYCSQRYYDPAVSGFLSKDPANSQGVESASQYCVGDPVGSTDPTGLIRLSIYAEAGGVDGESSSGLNIGGHSWISVRNNNGTALKLRDLVIKPGETLTVGTWGNMGQDSVVPNDKIVFGAHHTAWYDYEPYIASWVENRGGGNPYAGSVAVTQAISKHQLSKLTKWIKQHSIWDVYHTCAWFSSQAWKAAGAHPTFDAGLPPTPTALARSIQTTPEDHYQVNLALGKWARKSVGYYTGDNQFHHWLKY